MLHIGNALNTVEISRYRVLTFHIFNCYIHCYYRDMKLRPNNKITSLTCVGYLKWFEINLRQFCTVNEYGFLQCRYICAWSLRYISLYHITVVVRCFKVFNLRCLHIRLRREGYIIQEGYYDRHRLHGKSSFVCLYKVSQKVIFHS